MEADGQVALALVEETLQAGDEAHGGDGDALGTPAKAPVGGEHLSGGEYGVEVVHRLAHAHEDHVGQLVALGDGEELVEDVAGRERAMEALLTGDTEAAPHLASHLAGDAESGAVVLGNEDRLDVVSVEDGEEVFLGAVARDLASHGCIAADTGYLVEACPLDQGEVGHAVDAVDALLVEPVAELLGREAGETLGGAEFLQLRQGHAQQVYLLSFHCFPFTLEVPVEAFVLDFLLEVGAVHLNWLGRAVEVAAREVEF